MSEEKNIEQVYDLIESFDFDELSETDKLMVLSTISQEEYEDMRSTIKDTKELMDKIPVLPSEKKKPLIKRIAEYPIELYKVAATIILLIGISGILISRDGFLGQKDLIAYEDTVYVYKTDTVYQEKLERIEVIKEKIVYKEAPVIKASTVGGYSIPERQTQKPDCSKDICPTDIALLSEIKTRGNISNDSALTDFVVSIN